MNPILMWILKSQFHGWMSANTLIIAYHGRKSGREYTLPVQYVQHDNKLYIVPGYAEKKTWWKNFRQEMDVRVWLMGEAVDGKGVLMDAAADADEILQAACLYLLKFPPSAKMHNVRTAEDGTPDMDDVQTAVKGIKMLRVVEG
jgi:deazaflavin-dependent oxidoreductase (nitroreductase family)